MVRPALIFFVALCLSSVFPGCDCSDESLTPNSTPNNENPDQGTDTDTDMPGSVCDSCREDQICVDGIGGKECVCPPGTSRAEGVCVEDAICMPSTCNGHGTCTQDNNGLQCACELGWTGDFCGECDAVNGWVADGAGGCTDDLCSTIQCNDRVCQVTNGTPTCVCPAGTQDDGASACTPDEMCTATTCNGQGTCDDSGASPVCTCEEGWQQPNCQTCDTPAGYHPDGMGGCTNDPCLPNPCTAANQSGCVGQGITYTCECDPGYHQDAGVCVVDQTCTPTSCRGQGVCDDAGGIVSCECDPGYAGTNCAACDAAAGYHDDGLGNCTMDACLPNPCTQIPNKTQCVTGGTGYICECAAGYHDDGTGGCTNDPCTPNLCAANNQACRVTNGAAECYVPACDDQNPCTTDTLVNGVCVFSNLPNNTSCSTNACSMPSPDSRARATRLRSGTGIMEIP